MSSSLLTYRKKSFWVHNAIAEVWFYSFVQTALAEPAIPAWLRGMVDDISPALDAAWIDGVAMNAFDDHLTSSERLEFFLPLMMKINTALLSKASTGRVVSVDKFDAASEFLLPEIQMIEALFLRPESIHEPWKIFTVPHGWCVA
jgi:hypothetical protein